VQSTLGKLASDAAAVEAFVYAMEVAGGMRGKYFVPDRHMLYAAQVFTQELYPTFINAIRDLAGGSLIMLPSSAQDFASEQLRRIIDLTQASEVVKPVDRVKFLKLAWDVLGSEFASRHQQYEMFYAGAQFVTRGHSFRTYDWASSKARVDDVLAGYTLDQCLRPA
jgi:4-hydroxyphenylacetate 3-monooxygenase